MTVLLDTNVLLDVFLEREPHYAASAQVLSRVTSGDWKGVVASHAVTTFYYIARKQGDIEKAESGVDRVITHCDIASLNNAGWRRARGFAFHDFEDAAVAGIAEAAQCDWAVTRNTAHFTASPVPAIEPADLLTLAMGVQTRARP